MSEDVLFPAKAFLLLMGWLVKLLLVSLCWLFNRALARKLQALPTLAFWRPTLFPNQKRPIAEVLTVGDFVASAASGRFVKREQVHFVLV